MADDWAKPELGTGCVKITPAHDPNDYDVGLRQDLPMVNILNLDGTLNENAGPYHGQTVLEAPASTSWPTWKSWAWWPKVEDRQIELAHTDRSKTPIEPLLTDQWFVKMERLAQTAMDAVSDGRVKIIPDATPRAISTGSARSATGRSAGSFGGATRSRSGTARRPARPSCKRRLAGRDDVVWQCDEEYRQWLICGPGGRSG